MSDAKGASAEWRDQLTYLSGFNWSEAGNCSVQPIVNPPCWTSDTSDWTDLSIPDTKIYGVNHPWERDMDIDTVARLTSEGGCPIHMTANGYHVDSGKISTKKLNGVFQRAKLRPCVSTKPERYGIGAWNDMEFYRWMALYRVAIRARYYEIKNRRVDLHS